MRTKTHKVPASGTYSIQHPASRILHPVSSIPHPTLKLPPRASRRISAKDSHSKWLDYQKLPFFTLLFLCFHCCSLQSFSAFRFIIIFLIASLYQFYICCNNYSIVSEIRFQFKFKVKK